MRTGMAVASESKSWLHQTDYSALKKQVFHL